MLCLSLLIECVDSIVEKVATILIHWWHLKTKNAHVLATHFYGLFLHDELWVHFKHALANGKEELLALGVGFNVIIVRNGAVGHLLKILLFAPQLDSHRYQCYGMSLDT